MVISLPGHIWKSCEDTKCHSITETFRVSVGKTITLTLDYFETMPCLCIPFEAKPSLIFYKLHNVTGFPLGSRLRVGMYDASDQKSGDYKDAG